MGQQKILFIGDSLIEYYDWQARFPRHKVINMGRSGETVQELEQRSRFVAPKEELDWIFIMIGTNNVTMDDYSFLPSYENIVDTFREKFPVSKVVMTGLFPMRLSWISEDALPRLNKLLQGIAAEKKCLFMDGGLVFGQSVRGVRSCFSEDGVHLSDHGYSLWADEIEKNVG